MQNLHSGTPVVLMFSRYTRTLINHKLPSVAPYGAIAAKIGSGLCSRLAGSFGPRCRSISLAVLPIGNESTRWLGEGHFVVAMAAAW